jgi:hypothetical protein
MFKEGKNDDEFYIRNDFQKFKERYAERIKNFKEYLNTSKSITFIHHSYTSEQITSLNELLVKLYSNDFNYLAI